MLSNRKYYIDWIRVIAIGLLLIYHVAIGFQPWGRLIGFITNAQSWESLWIPMTMLNVWRIPLLFFVSGMGVYFAMQRRNWKQLITERVQRILLPFVFGYFCIVPIYLFMFQSNNGMKVDYYPNPGHLWFLANIFIYVVVLSPLFFFLKKNESGLFVLGMRKILSTPLAWVIVVFAFTAEALIVDPHPYELYALTAHGFVLGMMAFFFGFSFMLSGDDFWKMLAKWKWGFVSVAVGLFLVRWIIFHLQVPVYLLVAESESWIFSVLALGYSYLNRPSKVLDYLSEAAYPVYILHMIFLYTGASLVFPISIDVRLKFILVLLFTFAGCFVTYDFVVRRVRLLRFLFGLRKR
ncbi:MAG: acyltransferase family protein [Bacteroidetes bacterium]|nr:acyltransferase family protein [Bacteroidota bacterium]